MRRHAAITLRTAEAANARKIHALIAANQAEGRLLPRTLQDITAHAGRFVVAVKGRSIVGCAELAPLSPQVAEVRSLAVDVKARDRGVGAMLVEELQARARRTGYERFAAFTHTPAYFSRMGFSIVPHLWVTEKIQTDCVKCPLFRACGQYAMVVSLEDHKESPAHVPAASHHA
jgi:amino-acid N-acetyltransferase